MRQEKSRSMLSLGIALVLLGGLLLLGRVNVNPVESSTFESEPVEVKDFNSEDIPDEKLSRRIIIPSLSIDLKVEKSEIINGYWEVFEDKAGWGTGSGVSGIDGNQVIFAHARDGLFLPLKDVKEGMVIYILTDEGWYSYEVKEIKEVFPNETEVIAPTTDETLTLYTCSGFNDSKRLIVVAKPLEQLEQ